MRRLIHHFSRVELDRRKQILWRFDSFGDPTRSAFTIIHQLKVMNFKTHLSEIKNALHIFQFGGHDEIHFQPPCVRHEPDFDLEKGLRFLFVVIPTNC
jgi:hypothetical protein